MTDIAASMKALLSLGQDGARVVIEGKDVTVLQEGSTDISQPDRGIEGDRLKALGDFQVQVKVKGGDPVIRTVSIRAQGEPVEGAARQNQGD